MVGFYDSRLIYSGLVLPGVYTVKIAAVECRCLAVARKKLCSLVFLWMAGVVNLSRQKQAFWSFFWIHLLGSAPKIVLSAYLITTLCLGAQLT